MMFLYKLAQRLARLHTALILGAFAAIGCEVPVATDQAGTAVQLLVSPKTSSLRTGQTTQFIAVGLTSTGDTANVAVSWSVTGGDITDTSTTSHNRHLSMYKSPTSPGHYKILAKTATLTDSAVVDVSTVPVASVAVTPASAGMVAGQTVQLTATTLDSTSAALTGRVVTWGSSNSAVATVNGSGLVTGVAPGSATITATSEGKSGTAAVTVTVMSVPVATVGVTPASANMTVGQTAQLTATPRDASGNALTGRVVTWGSSNSAVATVNGSGLVTGVAAGSATITATSEGKSGASSVTVALAPVASVTVSPATVSQVVGTVQQLTATLRDASGNVLTGRTVSWSSSNTLVATVLGTGLETSLLAGSATITATSEGRSGTAAITVTAGGGGGGVVFQSDWSTATGTSSNAVQDGGRWTSYWEFNNGTGVQLLSVVSGASVNGPGGLNALKVLQRGSTFAANLQQGPVSQGGGGPPIVPVSTDYYVRFYMRNDDTSPPGDHIVTVDTWQYANLTFVRKMGVSGGWQFVSSFYGCGYTYPVGHWGPGVTLSHGVWYRFEYFVHFVDATHVQMHPRVYDASGTQIMGDADFRQSDYGASGLWNGSQTWTLASYYAAGYSFCVNPVALTSFGLGNNGQQGAVDTGLPWYFAGVQIRTDRWPGP